MYLATISLPAIGVGFLTGTAIGFAALASRPLIIRAALLGVMLVHHPRDTVRTVALGAIGAVRAFRRMRAGTLGAIAGALTGIAVLGAIIGLVIGAIIGGIVIPFGTDQGHIHATIIGGSTGAAAGALITLWYSIPVIWPTLMDIRTADEREE